jgi:hypothetical protein
MLFGEDPKTIVNKSKGRQTKKPLHCKRNNQQSEETTWRMGENIHT